MSWLDLIYPKKCFGCGKIGSYFCLDCQGTIELIPSRSFLFDTHHNLDGLISLFDYRGLMRLGIHKLKYRLVTDSQKEWSQLIRLSLGAKLSAESGWRLKKFLLTMPVVVPVPLYWRRKNWRGFNQAELLAKLVADNLKLCVRTDLLERVRATKSQVGLSRKDRQANLHRAFVVAGKAPRSVMIVDDVWTSGATIKEVARVLRHAGAETVWGLTLAR